MGMNFRAISSTFMLFCAVQLSSCAYMQTHKNIEEAQIIRTGYELTPDVKLYRSAGNYYIAASRQQLRKIYPAIHDSIFLTENNAPSWRRAGENSDTVYYHISSHTASVLQMQSGYATLDVLAEELKNNPCTDKLPAGATKCKVNAEITGSSTIWEAGETLDNRSIFTHVISAVDRVCIDWPGTVIYNAAIPVMAPFVFFHQFLNEN